MDRNPVYALWGAGCRDIIRDTFDSAVRSTYEALRVHPFDAERAARGFVEVDRVSMRELADPYDPDVPNHENASYRDRARELPKTEAEQIRAPRSGVANLERSERGWTPHTPDDVSTAAASRE